MRLKKFIEFRKINESVTDVKYDIASVKSELSDIKNQRSELENDMEVEAGQKGEDWSDEDGNRYGEEFNNLDEKEIELRKKLEQLVKELDVEEKREVQNENVNDFREIIESIADPSEFEVKYEEEQINLEVKIGEDEFEFTIHSTGDVTLNELNMELSLGDIYNDSEIIKNILLKIFSLDGDEYVNFIKSFNDGDSLTEEDDNS